MMTFYCPAEQSFDLSEESRVDPTRLRSSEHLKVSARVRDENEYGLRKLEMKSHNECYPSM